MSRSKTRAAAPTHAIRYPAAGLFELASAINEITPNMIGDPKGSQLNLREAGSVPTALSSHGGDKMAQN
jgi:hypothetical protein